MGGLIASIPSETDFLAAFGVEPEDSAPSDGYWAYTFEGPGDSHVRLSFNTHEESVQPARFVGGVKVATFVSEGAESIRIGDDECIRVNFAGAPSTTLTITFFPSVSVQWSSLW